MGKLRKTTLWVIAVCLLNVSCVIFHPEEYEKDELGYYIKHYNACGPKALEQAFSILGDKNVNRVDLSREIQNGGNTLRIFAALFHHDALEITSPNEMKKLCEKHGYEVVELGNMNQLKSEDVALVLVWGKILKREAHWMVFPADTKFRKAEGWYGPYTHISKIYLLKKNKF
jgi:hypothetical protein|tara:strand:- start:1546 stop:2061 length:516 start_codon:yes stop_codon:yes gene_type:complete